jgi:hypothetical protein
MNRRTFREALLLAALIATLTAGAVAVAQAPPKETRESLIKQIRKMAKDHVEGNEKMDSKFVVDLYREDAAKVGLKPREIAENYVEEYQTQQKAHLAAQPKETPATQNVPRPPPVVAAREAQPPTETAAAQETASRLGIVGIVLGGAGLVAVLVLGFYLVRRIQPILSQRPTYGPSETSAPRPTEDTAERTAAVPPDGAATPTRAARPTTAIAPKASVEAPPAEPNRAGSTLSRQLAGMRVMRGYAVVCYRTGVLEDFKNMTVQFDAARPHRLESLYVSPRIRDGITEVDPFTAVVRYQRVLLRGPSGAGKSVLLRRLALFCLQEGIPNLRGRPTPVLIELRRFTPAKLAAAANSGSARSPLEQELVDEFDRRGFPNADLFLGRALDQGRILLLFDGLDEVKMGVRAEVARLVKDLLRKYPRCRAIITCRSDAYKNEFAQAVDAALELEELSDQQIFEFLGQWKRTLPADHPFSVDRFLKVANSRERLIPLMRNPLILTMLAFVHTSSPDGLADTRAGIFERCVDLVLNRSNLDRSPQVPEVKKTILAGLALLIQESAESREGDGLTAEQSSALAEARRVICGPSYESRVPVQAEALLRELIEQDYFLVPADGGYRFAHRAFQDYFSAVALKDDPAGLVQRFRRSPAVWLNTVKLWCGMDHDSSDVLTAIFAEDPLTALLCLAESRQANTELAGRIFAAFRDRLGSSPDDGVLCRAFAMASHQEQYGEEVFQMLVSSLSPSERPVRRAAAARALALSNASRAASELAKVFGESAEFRQALQDMGDPAVGVLVELAKQGNAEALDSLRAIGTPGAALALVPLLWSNDAEVANRTAWRLASLLSHPSVEAALEHYEFPDGSPPPGHFEWIWEPFTKSQRSPLPSIAGKIVSLLERAPIESAPATRVELDPRLVIPLCGIIKKQDAWRLAEEPHAKMRATVTQAIRKSTGLRLARLRPGDPGSVDAETAEARERFVALVLHLTQPTKTWRYLLESLKPDVQFNFLYGLFQGPSPRRLDWLEIGKTPSWRYLRNRNPLRAFPVDGVVVHAANAATANGTPAGVSVGSS